MQPTLDLSIELAANLLVQCKIDSSVGGAKHRIGNVISSGQAFEKFRKNVELQNGDASICDKPQNLWAKKLVETEILAAVGGYVSDVDTLAVGNAVCALGGGRIKAEDSIDNGVGYSSLKKIGESVKKGETIGIVYSRKQAQADAISESLSNAYKISKEVPRIIKLIRAVV